MIKQCKRCGSDTIRTSLEANDTFWIHIHLICKDHSDHPYYCETEGRWID